MKELPRLHDQYELLIGQIRKFRENKVKPISPARRKDLALELADVVYKGDGGNIPEAIELAKLLLKTDPLSDQLAGVIARTKRDAFRVHTIDQKLAIVGGDWDEIVWVLRQDDESARALEKNLKLVTPSNFHQIVYRELDLDPAEAWKIKRYGLLPNGIHFCGGFDESIWAEMHYSFQWGDFNERLQYDLSRWAISKSNLYRQVWEEGDFGTSNPYKLGQSTTTYENLKNPKRLRHGRLLIALNIEAERLVREGGINDSWDHEHTFLFDVEPERVLAIYDAAPIRSEQVWRLVSQNPLERFISGLGHRLA